MVRNAIHTTIAGFYNPSSQHQDIVFSEGKPRFVSEPYFYQVAIGNGNGGEAITYHQIATKDTITTETDMTNVGCSTIQIPTAAYNLQIVSASSLDVPGSTGAFTVLVDGLDSNWARVTEIHTLNGLTPITTTASMIRVNFLNVVSAGTLGRAAGDITVQDSSGGSNYLRVSSGDVLANQIYYTVPISKQAIVVDMSAGGLAGNITSKGRLTLKSTACPCDRSINRNIYYPNIVVEFGNNATQTVEAFALPWLIPAQASFKITAERAEGASTITANARVDFWVEDIS